eukprot:gene23218-30439_t
MAQFKADISSFVDVIKQCSGGTIVVVDMSDPALNPSRRAWCLYEWEYTLFHRGPEGLHMHGLSREDRANIVENIDVNKAESEMPEDKAMILDRIKTHHGSAEAFNTSLRTQLMLRPLSHGVDRKQLSMRSKGTKWRMERLEAWYKAGDTRALCIMAVAGTGKSTLADHICASILCIPREVQTNKAGLPSEHATDCKLALNAAHFMKHSDVRRLDPVASRAWYSSWL